MTDTKVISSSIHDYKIHFEKDFSFLPELLRQEDAVFIIDKKVFDLYEEFAFLKDNNNLLLLDAIEENKTLEASEGILDKIILLRPTKKTKIISIGGGITQDVSGFAASIFFRGLKWEYVPTTLLAQADSCMGSKTSLNYKSYKNILGTFYPPHTIYICTSFISSLKDEDFYSGMGEVAKLHAMGGLQTLDLLLSKMTGVYNKDIPTVLELTKSSLDIKWSYMDGDEFDQGKRNMLNYGHCFGHAIETATHYKIPHGQAVVLGMILANKVALDKNYISEALNDKLNSLFFDILKCDFRQLRQIENEVIIGAMKQDKKRIGTGLPLIMPNSLFEFFKITDLSEEQASTALNFFKNTYCN